ncbi:hypothetical protein CHARACLAT_002031 [Characodon lateralis]|uniref:Uncharacterized protein n=1 Tax=Characodon lateralis TaxID=208331 RepID=A0ABU7D3D5_9TELE|nr:hypothetical protein [Characodon lateralis]
MSHTQAGSWDLTLISSQFLQHHRLTKQLCERWSRSSPHFLPVTQTCKGILLSSSSDFLKAFQSFSLAVFLCVSVQYLTMTAWSAICEETDPVSELNLVQ